MLPSEYIIVHAAGSVIRFDMDTGREIRAWMRQWEGIAGSENQAIDVVDLHGSDVTLWCGAINVLYNCTADSREKQRQHDKDLEDEAKEFR